MALIIEDGTIVDDANTYITVTEARDYAALRNLTLPVDDADVEPLIVRAFDYLESLDYKGTPVESLQPSEFPRENIFINGEELPTTPIPKNLKDAQSQLAFETQTTELLPSASGRSTVREKVDVIEVQYSDTGVAVATPTFKTVDALLKDLLASSAGITRTIRI